MVACEAILIRINPVADGAVNVVIPSDLLLTLPAVHTLDERSHELRKTEPQTPNPKPEPPNPKP